MNIPLSQLSNLNILSRLWKRICICGTPSQVTLSNKMQHQIPPYLPLFSCQTNIPEYMTTDSFPWIFCFPLGHSLQNWEQRVQTEEWRELLAVYPNLSFLQVWIKSLECRCVYFTSRNNLRDIQSISWGKITLPCWKAWNILKESLFHSQILHNHNYFDYATISISLFGTSWLYSYY